MVFNILIKETKDSTVAADDVQGVSYVDGLDGNSSAHDDDILSRDNKPPYRKPYCRCIFCETMCSKLTNHIKNRHKLKIHLKKFGSWTEETEIKDLKG